MILTVVSIFSYSKIYYKVQNLVCKVSVSALYYLPIPIMSYIYLYLGIGTYTFTYTNIGTTLANTCIDQFRRKGAIVIKTKCFSLYTKLNKKHQKIRRTSNSIGLA